MSKEKECKCCKRIWYEDMLDKKFELCPNCYEYCKPLIDGLKIKDKQIADLEAKLAESESELEKQKEKYDKLYGCYKKTSSEDLQDKYSLAEENEQLKKQLTEKEEEYQSFKKIADENVNYLKNRILEETKNYNQDKISFAIEQLEKVKEEMDLRPRGVSKGWKNKEYDTLVEEDVYEVIDNQIKQLKEMLNEK